MAQKQYRAGKAGAAGYTQLHCALFMEGVTRIQEFYAQPTKTGFIPRAVRVGLVMNKLALGPRTLDFLSVDDSTRLPMYVHSSIIRGIETARLDAAFPTEEPLLRRNARITKSAEQMALRFQHLNDASLSTIEMTSLQTIVLIPHTYNFFETSFLTLIEAKFIQNCI